MNPDDRKRIDLLCEMFMEELTLEQLWPKLLDNNIFDRDDVNVPNWEKSLADPKTAKEVCLMIKTRGPNAYANFILSLQQSNHQHLVNKLSGSCPVGPYDLKNASPEVEINDDFHKILQETFVPLKITVRKSSNLHKGHQENDCYRMQSKPRGLVLLITNVKFTYPFELPDRDSALIDQTNIIDLFTQLDFEIIAHQDLTVENMRGKIKDFSQSSKLKTVDSVFVIISSHGLGNKNYYETIIYGTDYSKSNKDYKHLHCVDVIDYFNSKDCPDLIGKPKIFFLQACRGKQGQKSVSRYQKGNKFQESEVIELKRFFPRIDDHKDVLFVYATLPGFLSYRDRITGSWFLQILCEVFMNHAHDKHIEDLLNLIDRRLSTKRHHSTHCAQTLQIINIGFAKYCYINPGLF